MATLNNDFDPLAYGATEFDPTQYGATAVDNYQSPTSPATPQEQPSWVQSVGKGALNIGKNVFNALTSSEQEFGKDIGKSTYLMSGGQKEIGEIMKQNLESGNNLVKLAKRTTDPVRRQRLLELAAQDFQEAGMTSENIIGQIKSNEQILGEAGGTLVDILSAGTYGNAAKGMKAGQLGKVAPSALSGIQKGVGFGKGFMQGAKTGAIAGGSYGLAKGATTAMEEGKSAQGVAESAIGSGIIGAGTAGLVSGIAGGIAGRVGKSGKTYEEVINTPEKDVHTLSKSDRQAWTQYQSSLVEKSKADELANLKKTADFHNQKVMENLKTQTIEVGKQLDDLEDKLVNTSQKKTLELRPKMVEAFSEQSKTYRKLVDEELADKADLGFQAGNLKQFVSSRHQDNPTTTELFIDRLGLKEVKDNTPLTVGDVYDKLVSMKKGISSSSTKGVRSYTADEKLTDDAIQELSAFLKENGVDLTEANKFWRKYAPIRDRLIKEAKPFNDASIDMDNFAKTLRDFAKQPDVDNTNFIGAVEDLLGQKITGETKGIVEQMNNIQKEQLINEMWAQAQKRAIREGTSVAKQGVASKYADKADNVAKINWNIENKAKLRDWFRGIAKIAAGGAVIWAAYKIGGIPNNNNPQ